MKTASRSTSRPSHRITGVSLVTAALFAATACGAGTTDAGAGPGSGGGGKGHPQLRIAVGIDASYAPFYVAGAEGLWAKHGVDVDLVQFAKGGEGVDALNAGQVQMAGNSDATTIGLLGQNPDLRSLLVYENSGRYLKVVLGPGVKTAKDIRKMAVVPGLSELAATRFLESKGIKPGSVEFVTSDPAEIPALTKKGDMDAYVLWEPWPSKGEELGAKILETTGDYGLSYQHWLLSTSPWLKDNKDTAAKVAAALAEAAEKVESDPDTAAKATEDAAKIPTAQTVNAVKEIDFGVRDFTAEDLKGYEDTARFYLDTGKVKARPDVARAVQRGWLPDNPAQTEGS
ncbi:ABC transporter substrate-binding protein [Streptomyces sp. TRM66268-LWL]|uniref:ABC transporter substrate-binding protein n=1 Tax=Streptomyces polyasparticus TaxID=2767826 RepID=A0ABR7SCK9_9ACTN|nr:ABC transporter substrate-binding protein [Streptomyces polyasparticus]MBC9713220.1 ABC transporter substrate-binding protein [Streptomyces polyasparticus]